MLSGGDLRETGQNFGKRWLAPKIHADMFNWKLRRTLMSFLHILIFALQASPTMP